MDSCVMARPPQADASELAGVTISGRIFAQAPGCIVRLSDQQRTPVPARYIPRVDVGEVEITVLVQRQIEGHERDHPERN